MEDGWQMKCGVNFPGSSSRVTTNATSEQIYLHEARNQMNMNLSHCILPLDVREQGPLSPQMKQAPASHVLNFSSRKPIQLESGSAVHSLLSASPSLSQCDFQRQLNMHFSSGGCIPDTSYPNNVGTMPTWPLLQNRKNLNARAGVDVYPVSRPIMNSNNGCSHGPSDNLDALKAFITYPCSRNESEINTSLEKGVTSASSSSSNLQDTSLQTSSSVAMKRNGVASGCPRVFCLGACGDLLLSNTGLFGILCSCHGMHMSVSKFCEHAGLSNVHPGYAVRMDSGESIAQWRKVYLQKFGIRAPGDHRGWDWPEGLLATSGLANSSMVVADRRKDFDMSSLFNSPAESSTQPQNNASISRPRSTQTFSNQILKNAQIRNGCDHSNMEISRRNSCNMTDNPKIACPSLINCDNEGSGDGCVSRPFHFIPYCENSFSSAFHNLQSVDSKASNNSKDEIVLKRGPITSSIELKLGQPSQLSQGSGSVVLTSVRPHTSGVRTSTVQEKLNHNFENISEKNKQRISCQSASDFSRVLESFQGGPLNSAPTSSMESPGNNLLISSNGSVHVENLKKELHYSSGFSVPVSPSNIIARGSLYHKEINNRMTDSHPFNHWTLHQPHVTRSVIDLSYNGDAPIWPLDVNKSALPNNIGRSMDATCGYEGSNEGSSRLYAKQMESSGFARNKNSCNPNNSALSAAKFNLRGLTDMVPGVSGSSNIVRNACNPASNLDRDQFSNKLNSSSFSFTTPTLQVTSSGFTPLYTVLDPGHDSVSFSKDVEAVSNENLKLHALRNVDISFKNIPMDSALVFDQWTRIHSEQRQENKNCTISDLRAPGFFPDQGPFEGQGHGRPFCNGQIVVPSFLLDADHKKGVNLGANSEEITIPSELIDKYNEDPCDPQPKKLSSLSVGRRENLESDCNMVQRCNGGSSFLISARCNYNVQTVCSRREQENKDSSSMYGFKEQASIAVVETPKYNSSAISEDCISIEKEIPVECHGKENEQKSKLDWGNFQWTDVPSKKTKVSKVRCPDAPTYLLDTKEESEANLKELAAEDTSRLNQAAELLLVKELSEISSGCSVPAVTQASNEVNMIDSGTVDGGQTVYNKDLVADQESAISTSSSVEGIDSLRSLQLVCDGKIISTDEKSSTMFENEAHHGVINEFKRSCSKSNELQTFGGKFSEVSNKAQNDYGFKPRKRKRITKWKTLGTSFAVSSHCAPKDVQLLLQSNQNSSKILNIKSSEKILERRRPALFSARMPSRKRALRGMCNILEGDPSDERLLKGNDDSIDMPENAVTKKYKHVDPAAAVKATVAVKGYWLPKSISNRNLKCSSKGCQVVKPVACGKYGIISDQELDIDQIKPPKIVPLSQVLKASKRHVKFEKEPVLPSMRKRNNIRCNSGRKPHDVPFCSHRGQGNRCSKGLSFHSSEDSSIQETQQIHMDNTQSDDPDVFVEGSAGVDIRNLSISTSPDSVSKTKELRMRSLYELSMRGNKFISADISRSQNVMCAPSTECRLEMTTPVDARKSDGDERGGSGRRSCRKLPFSSLMPEKDKLCCVCGISNKDIANCLLECGHCSIQIHQACYGISRVPKGDWYCRPCRTNSKDVACVLCGYGGGAMTRAFGSRNVVKSLLKAWDIRTEPHIMSVGSAEALYVPAKMERRNTMDSEGCQPCPLIKPVVHNSIISGLFDPTVKQWVHMVCGLWTPGTRCPNVDTMSAFDVSGVSLLKEYMVCYMCNRAGGSCIRCSVEKCCTHFHPWCAHQKGLLQSEVEGVDKDQIGFYGRCLLHAKSRACYLENDNDTDKAYSEIEQEKEPTCARTVGYKGKTQGDGGNYSSYQHSGKGGCLVTQVQVDAWLYINRHKLSRNKQPKPPVLDVDHDYRKEYARYKQAKGWKHLVVYKSGIHALGLYTSQFFQRGAMVVEYIGEIVGHRVADKREAEYLSGRKYKSACYFFRIDKEQIIDATCRGGIARFVNHSCQPNCAAKVLTIRGEKKVVFFAQRDIYPGEEITYDYHFNREDEGKKIPCFCNSGNCRRYLN